ncbi:MAG: endonuclease [Saprospiraceae bacterium]
MRFLGTFFIALLLFQCKTTQVVPSQKLDEVSIAFYNVENLFDTLDNPDKNDDDFTPTGENRYDASRYQTKLEHIERVLTAMGQPEVVGLCEVENKEVVQDLVKTGALADFPYEVIHFESPDERGIDNALIYRTDKFKVLSSEFIRIVFPDDMEEDATRDVLVVRGQFSNEKDILLLVNHWPSRRGGAEASEPKRVFVAGEIMKNLDTISKQYENIPVLLMGDFNDEPQNNSIYKTLGAIAPAEKPEPKQFYNLFLPMDLEDKGTYNYRGNWNMMDQIIVTGNLVSGQSGYIVKEPQIFSRDWMFYEDKKYGPVPSKTYGGPNYYGGYSDHLPVMVKVEVLGR